MVVRETAALQTRGGTRCQLPRTYAIASSDDADALDVTFPVILKPNMGGGDTAISRAKVIRADDRQALKAAFAAASGEIGAGNVVVQELIPGGEKASFPMRRSGEMASLLQNSPPDACVSIPSILVTPAPVSRLSTTLKRSMRQGKY